MPDTYIKFDGVDGESIDMTDTFDFTTTEDDTSTTSRDAGEGNDLLIGSDGADVLYKDTGGSETESQDGSDLLIVNNGDGSDFYGTGFTGGVYVAAGDFSGDTVVIDDMAIL